MADVMRATGPVIILQTLQASRVIPALPAVEHVRADPKVTAGEPGIVPVPIVEVHPLQPAARLPRQALADQSEQRVPSGHDLAADVHGARIAPLQMQTKPLFSAKHAPAKVYGIYLNLDTARTGYVVGQRFCPP